MKKLIILILAMAMMFFVAVEAHAVITYWDWGENSPGSNEISFEFDGLSTMTVTATTAPDIALGDYIEGDIGGGYYWYLNSSDFDFLLKESLPSIADSWLAGDEITIADNTGAGNIYYGFLTEGTPPIVIPDPVTYRTSEALEEVIDLTTGAPVLMAVPGYGTLASSSAEVLGENETLQISKSESFTALIPKTIGIALLVEFTDAALTAIGAAALDTLIDLYIDVGGAGEQLYEYLAGDYQYDYAWLDGTNTAALWSLMDVGLGVTYDYRLEMAYEGLFENVPGYTESIENVILDVRGAEVTVEPGPDEYVDLIRFKAKQRDDDDDDDDDDNGRRRHGNKTKKHTFTVTVENEFGMVQVTTRIKKKLTSTTVLREIGTSVIDELGFQLTLEDVVTNNGSKTYTVSVENVSARKDVKYVTLGFGRLEGEDAPELISYEHPKKYNVYLQHPKKDKWKKVKKPKKPKKDDDDDDRGWGRGDDDDDDKNGPHLNQEVLDKLAALAEQMEDSNWSWFSREGPDDSGFPLKGPR